MEKQPNQVTNNSIKKEEPLRSKPSLAVAASGGGGGGVDRSKRDEWSEGAVTSLLDAYELKYVLRNRAKLKGHDWEDVARHVSSRANSTKTPKTQTQCKNKIESIKKRYRSESATTADTSSWPLFRRLDLLLRGHGGSQTPRSPPNPPLMLLDQPQPPPPLPPPPPSSPPHHGFQQDFDESNGVERRSKEDGGAKVLEHGSDKAPMDQMDSSTIPISDDGDGKSRKKLKSMKTKMRINKKKKKNKKKTRRRVMRGDREVGDSVRLLGEVVVRSEQARMDTMKEIERIRAEVETKKGEIDLKRTQIIANSQLQIARLLAGDSKSTNVDSSLRIGRN